MDYIVWHITENEEELRASLQHPEYYATKIAPLRQGSRRLLEVLAVRRALKELFYGKEQIVEYDASGRPSLSKETCPDPPFISISHTADFVAVITSSVPVGIDIERRGNRVARVVSHFLQPAEVARLSLLSNQDESVFNLFLHLCWSAKEAAFKVLGQAYHDLQRLTTVNMISLDTRQIRLDVSGLEHPLLLFFDYTEDYVLVWVEKNS